MEYWTGRTLSHPITQVKNYFFYKYIKFVYFKLLYMLIFVVHRQEIITSFRFKLAATLLCWKKNTAPATTMIETDDLEGDPNDLMMSD